MKVPKSIVEGDYSRFDGEHLGKNGYFQIYNHKGDKVYPEHQENGLQSSELVYIPSEAKRPIVTIEEFEDFHDTQFKEVTLEYYNNLNKIGMDVIVVDEDYNINYTTFNDLKHSITEKELLLLMGNFQNRFEVSKSNYIGDDGAGYVIVYFRPFNVFNLTTNTLYGVKGYLFSITLLVFVIISAFFLYRLNHIVNEPVKLLTNAIRELSFGNTDKVINYKGPREFENVCHDFNEMQCRLNHEIRLKEELESDKSMMLASVSHDLKIPVTVINGYASALSDGKIKEQDKHRIYDKILDRGVYLGNLIESFNIYHHIDQGSEPISKETIDFSKYIVDFFHEHYDEIRLSGRTLEMDIEKDIYLNIDGMLMKRVLENLLGNVYKYTPATSTIMVSVSGKEKYVGLTFSDDGPGISEELLPHLFSPFTIGDDARSDKYGSGLGMAIVKRVIELHDGTIEVINNGTFMNGTAYFIQLSR